MFAFVRLAVAGTCVLTAAALAIVATASSNNSSGPVSKPVLKPTAQDTPDADKNWNALSLPFVVGPKGRIGKLRPEALKP